MFPDSLIHPKNGDEMLRKNLLVFLAAWMFVLAPFAYAGKVEYPTLYPSPAGEYQNIYSLKTSYFATDTGENVGIGTDEPGRKLVVLVDGLNYDSAYGLLQLGNSTSGGETSIGFVSGMTASGLPPTSDNGNNYIWVAGAGTYGIGGNKFGIGNAGYGANIMTLTSSGDVGIGNASPGYKLTINGTAWCSSGLWEVSDLRWKKNITPLNDPLEKLTRLRGVEFDWKREEFKDMNFPEGRQIGMIAQELEKEFPELVMTGKDGYKSIEYDKFTAVLLEVLKTQEKEIELLEEEIAELKKLSLKKKTGKVR
jgi:hypothetical protein